MLKRNLVANYLGQGWNAVMGLAFIPLYIQYLGMEAYGLIGLFAVMHAWLSLLDMGMTPTLGREMARFTGGTHSATSIRDLLRSIEIVAIGIALLITGGITLSSSWMATSWLQVEKLPIPVVAQAFAIMGAVTALRFVQSVYHSSLVGLQRQVLLNVLGSAMAAIKGFGGVGILIWVSPTIEAFVIWQGLTALASLAILAVATYGALPNALRAAKFSLEALRGVWKFAGGMMSLTLLGLLLTQVDKILLSKLLTLSEYGYYTLASVVAAALFMLVAPITMAWLPRLTQLHAVGDNAGLARSFHQGAQLVSVFAGSAAVVIMVYAETLLHVWMQDADMAHRTAHLLSLLVLGNLLNALMWMPYQTQFAYGRTGLIARISIVAVAVIVPAIFWVTPRYGAIGAAWVWVSLNAGICLIGIHFMYRRTLRAEKWRWYGQDILQPLLAAAATVLLVAWLLPNPASIIAQLSTLTLASVLTLAAAALAAKQVRQQMSAVITLFFHHYA